MTEIISIDGIIGLIVATVTIFVRSIFRVAELNGGFNGSLANNEITFMILEGAMIVIACACLTIFHPGPCFGGRWGQSNWSLRKKKDPQWEMESNIQKQ